MTATKDPTDGAVPVVYTVDEVAALLKCSRSAVGGLLDRGQLTAVKFAPTRRGAVRIPKWSVDQFLAQESEGAA